MSVEHCPKSFVFLLGVPAIAVGLSAISFSASFPSRSQNPVKKNLVPVTRTLFPFTLQKDAAPIPNALEAIKTKILENF